MNSLSKLVIVVVFTLALIGCVNTVAPKATTDKVASWDGTNQNSGFIGYLPNGSGLITPHARNRYNGLIGVYSKRFMPPLAQDAGLKPNGENWEIDPEHIVKFATMNRWRKSGVAP